MKILMIVPDPMVKGGIAAVVNGYRGSSLENNNQITYIESYRNGTKSQKLLKACHAYLQFVKEIRKNRPDVVHIHSSFGPSFYRKMPFILWGVHKRIPVVNHIHGAEFAPFYEEASAGKKNLIRKIYNKCTVLIVLSEEWKKKIGQIVPEEKLEILENYCKIPETINWAKRDSRQILFLGELGKRKGCFDIPEILKKTITDVPDVRLVMAGDGELEQAKQVFADQNLLEKVTFPGWVRGKQKEILLQESAVFLFPSYHEGMPMAVLEAMGYALGIVTTKVGGIPKLIQDGENGFCKEAGDVNSLAEALICLLKDDSKRMEMGMAARKLADESYGLDQHLHRLQKIYEKACRPAGIR